MHYIIFDLEWNQAMDPSRSVPGLPSEIIEIGAMKLTEDLRPAGRFETVIRPQVYKRLHHHVRKLTHVRADELESGLPFAEAARRFLAWAGEDAAWCTWGPSDLPELQRNIAYFCPELSLPWPLFYYDVQKLYGLQYDGRNTGKALEAVVDELKLEKDVPFHRADADTYYTMRVMQQLDMKRLAPMRSVDYYRIPQTREDQIRLKFETYSKFVSCGFASPDKLMKDKEVTDLPCPFCGGPTTLLVPWHAGSTHNYLCVGTCPTHGKLRGKLRVRRHPSDVHYAVRTIRSVDEEEAKAITEKYESAKERRREQRREARIRKKSTT